MASKEALGHIPLIPGSETVNAARRRKPSRRELLNVLDKSFGKYLIDCGKFMEEERRQAQNIHNLQFGYPHNPSH